MMASFQATKNAMSADSAIAAKQKLTRRSPTRKGRSGIQLKGHMRSRMKPVTVRGYGSFQSISMLFPVKDLGATFSRNSNADETLGPVKEVCDNHYMQRYGQSVPVMPTSGRSPTSRTKRESH